MPQKQKASIMDADGMRRAIHRISYEILEKNRGARDIVLVGIVRRGAVVAERIADKIFDVEGTSRRGATTGKARRRARETGLKALSRSRGRRLSSSTTCFTQGARCARRSRRSSAAAGRVPSAWRCSSTAGTGSCPSVRTMWGKTSPLRRASVCACW